MARIQSKPLLKTFKLASDVDGEAEIVVRQAREGEHIERNNLFAKQTRVYDQSDDIKLQQEFNRRALARKEAYITLGRVTGITDEHGNELFKTKESDDGPSVKAAMSEQEFNRKWNLLDPRLAAEIVEAVYDVNPLWDPNYQGE